MILIPNKRILSSGCLGARDEEAYKEYMAQCVPKDFEINPHECEGTGKSAGPFGFWLPNGTSQYGDNPLQDATTRFNRIEEMFKVYFRIGDDALLLERTRKRVFEEHPEKLPGHIDKKTRNS